MKALAQRLFAVVVVLTLAACTVNVVDDTSQQGSPEERAKEVAAMRAKLQEQVDRHVKLDQDEVREVLGAPARKEGSDPETWIYVTTHGGEFRVEFDFIGNLKKY